MSRDDRIRAAYSKLRKAKEKAGTVARIAAKFEITPTRVYQIVSEGAEKEAS